MAEVKWIKLATNLFDNRKIKQIESLPESDGIIVIWLKLLCLAGSINDSGNVYFTNEIPYTDQMLANQFAKPIALIQLALKTFENFGMIEVIDDILHISNWEKYQNIEGMEKIREQNRIRQKNFYEKQKEVSNVRTNVSITQPNATDIDIDKDIINNISIADLSAKEPKIEIIKHYFDDEQLNNAFNNWVKYKKEKRQAYKETGLLALVSRVQKNADKYGASKIVDAIEKSMSANYQGIVWDWITNTRGCLSTEERVEKMKNEFTNNFKFKNSVPERFMGE